MKFMVLVLRNLTRSKTRTLLTGAGVAVCVFIFAALLSLDQGVRRMLDQTSGDDMLIVFERYKACPPYSKMPVHYADAIAEVPHVAGVMPVRFLLSNCGTTTDLVALHGIEPARFREFRKIEIPAEQYAAFSAERGSAIAGASTARKYGWQLGQQVTLPQLRGISFTLRGIFSAPGSSLEEVILVDREYLERSIDEPGLATLFMVRLDDPAHAHAVSANVDTLFANYDKQTKTGPEHGFIAAQIGGFKEIVRFAQLVAYMALVLLLAAVANSVSMTVRDRLREMALLKLVGFDSGRVSFLVLLESALLGLLASIAGTGLALLLVGLGNVSISVEGFTMYPELSPAILAVSVVAGVALCLFGAWWPVHSAARRPIVLALKGVD